MPLYRKHGSLDNPSLKTKTNFIMDTLLIYDDSWLWETLVIPNWSDSQQELKFVSELIAVTNYLISDY